jgi:hypothetical protein
MDGTTTMTGAQQPNYSVTTERLGTQQVKEILHGIDLNNMKSILQYFPLVPGKGPSEEVPLAIRGASSDPGIAFKAIRTFRNMSEKDQKMLRDYSSLRDMKPIFKANIQAVMRLKNGSTNQSPPAVSAAQGTNITSTPVNVTTTATRAPTLPAETSVPVTVTARAQAEQRMQQQQQQHRSSEPSASAANNTLSPLRNRTNEPPMDEGEEAEKPIFRSLAASPRTRELIVQEIFGPEKKKRKHGDNAETLGQQWDHFSRRTLEAAMKSFATASDTSHFSIERSRALKEAGTTVPRVRMVLMHLTELRDPTARGGVITTGNCRRVVPRLLIAAHERRDTKEIFRALREYYQEGSRRDNIEKVELVASEGKSLSEVVEQYYDRIKQARQGPSSSEPSIDQLPADAVIPLTNC